MYKVYKRHTRQNSRYAILLIPNTRWWLLSQRRNTYFPSSSPIADNRRLVKIMFFSYVFCYSVIEHHIGNQNIPKLFIAIFERAIVIFKYSSTELITSQLSALSFLSFYSNVEMQRCFVAWVLDKSIGYKIVEDNKLFKLYLHVRYNLQLECCETTYTRSE